MNSQEEFNTILGIQPRMYHAFEQDEEDNDAWRKLKQFVNACQLDIFISVCRMEYIGTDTADTTFYVQEVCNDIPQLPQVRKYGKGRTFTDTPDDLYQRHLNHEVILQYNATSWSLQIPPTYLSVLEDKLRRHVTSADDFRMPYLIILHTK